MRKKLIRKKLPVKKLADIRHLARNIEWKIEVESGSPIIADYLSHIHDGEIIFEQLLIWLRKFRKKRVLANTVLRYLKFIAYSKGVVSAKSLKDFKNDLNTQSEVTVNTKSQVFSTCKNFVSFLMQTEVIQTEKLSKNFERIKPKGKPSIMELVPNEVRAFAVGNPEYINSLMKKNNLKEPEASALAYGKHIIELYHSLSLERFASWLEDSSFVDNIIESLTPKEQSEISRISDFRDRAGDWRTESHSKRSLEFAIQILFVKFGRLIPPADLWPSGVVDFCKSKGWTPKRIQAAFFTGANNLQFLGLAALSHKSLAPDVDSVFFYAYTDSIKPSSERGKVVVHFGKKRGAPCTEVLPASDRFCKLLHAYQERLKWLLELVPEGRNWLRKEHCELFIHFINNSIRTIDPTTPCGWVRRATKELATEYSIFKPLVKAITGEAFRSTISVVDILSGSSIGKLKNKLNHKHIFTTKIYAIKGETQALHDRKLLDFQDFMIENRKGFPTTGTGYLCGIDEEPAVQCSGIELCFECKAKRLVIKDKQLIAEWLAHSNYIIDNEARLKFNNPDRWQHFWKPKLTEYQALIAQCTRVDVKAAELLASKIVLPFWD